jgi:hypothetical protein
VLPNRDREGDGALAIFSRTLRESVHYAAVHPPSMVIAEPVMNSASREHK